MNIGREPVLTRDWEIANLPPEMTRSSITGRVKALSIIVAIEGLIPDRRRGSASDKNPPRRPAKPNTYVAKWLRELRGETTEPQTQRCLPEPIVPAGRGSTALSPCRPASWAADWFCPIPRGSR